MVNCRYCGKECKNARSESIHKNHCELNPNRRDVSGENHPNFGKSWSWSDNKLDRIGNGEDVKCSFCDEIKKNLNAKSQHELYCEENPNKREHHFRGRQPWNFGKAMSDEFKKAVLDGLTNMDPEKRDAMEKKISAARIGRRHTEATKKKISKARKAYMEKHPEKHPYVMYHASKGIPYSERYWCEVFDNRGIEYKHQYRISRYALDFAFLHTKVNLEIDGAWHYSDQKCIEKDRRRDKFLASKGWRTIRVKWGEFKSLEGEAKSDFIDSIVEQCLETVDQHQPVNVSPDA